MAKNKVIPLGKESVAVEVCWICRTASSEDRVTATLSDNRKISICRKCADLSKQGKEAIQNEIDEVNANIETKWDSLNLPGYVRRTVEEIGKIKR